MLLLHKAIDGFGAQYVQFVYLARYSAIYIAHYSVTHCVLSTKNFFACVRAKWIIPESKTSVSWSLLRMFFGISIIRKASPQPQIFASPRQECRLLFPDIFTSYCTRLSCPILSVFPSHTCRLFSALTFCASFSGGMADFSLSMVFRLWYDGSIIMICGRLCRDILHLDLNGVPCKRFPNRRKA